MANFKFSLSKFVFVVVKEHSLLERRFELIEIISHMDLI